MTYVVTENCIRCKYMDCVEVCPVDCFYVGANMLVIHPDECIDCGVCEPECPAEAILPDSDDTATAWVEQNRKFAALWPNITRKGEPPARLVNRTFTPSVDNRSPLKRSGALGNEHGFATRRPEPAAACWRRRTGPGLGPRLRPGLSPLGRGAAARATDPLFRQ